MQVVTFVMAGGQGERLFPLTKDRAKPSVPFAGIYRIIDFTLSNCLNSRLKRIFLLTQYKSFALEKHIYTGWKMFVPELGEFLHCLPPQKRIESDWYLGTADAVYQNLYSLKSVSADYVFILSGDHIYKMDYRKMLRYHRRKNADMTLALYEVPIQDAHRFGVLEIDKDYRILGFQEKPQNPKPMPEYPDKALISMGVYLFNTPALVSILMVDAENSKSSHDFGRDIIPKMINGYKVYGYPFVDENRGWAKYWRDVGTIDEYYDAHMDLISPEPIFNLYDTRWPIRTVQCPFPPAKTVFADHKTSRVGMALNSLVANGAIISGGRVERSVISPLVKINSFAEVTDSILMEGIQVGRYAKIRRTIIDKRVKIPERMTIGYNLEEDKKRFTVTDSGIVVIPKEMQI